MDIGILAVLTMAYATFKGRKNSIDEMSEC